MERGVAWMRPLLVGQTFCRLTRGRSCSQTADQPSVSVPFAQVPEA